MGLAVFMVVVVGFYGGFIAFLDREFIVVVVFWGGKPFFSGWGFVNV